MGVHGPADRTAVRGHRAAPLERLPPAVRRVFRLDHGVVWTEGQRGVRRWGCRAEEDGGCQVGVSNARSPCCSRISPIERIEGLSFRWDYSRVTGMGL